MKLLIHRLSLGVHHSRSALTLIEILVVVGILALLAAILFPAFSRARNMARRASCISNLRQVGLASQMYERDESELTPRLSLIYPTYLSDARLFICPNDSLRGQIDGNDRLKGNLYLSSGVIYQCVPNWMKAQEQNWYRPAPRYGEGRWRTSRRSSVVCGTGRGILIRIRTAIRQRTAGSFI